MEILEYLKSKLTEEQLKSFEGVELKGDVFHEPMVPVRRVNEVTAEKKSLEEQLTSQKTLLEGFKGSAELSDTLKAKLSDMESENKRIQTQFTTDVAKIKSDHLIDLQITGLKPKNFKSVSALFNRSEIKVDGEELLGFKGQAEKIIEDNPFLFEEGKTKDLSTDEGDGTKTSKVNPWKIGSISLSEQVRMRRDNPSLASKLQGEANPIT
jgi:hypothetical protein